MVVLFRHMFFLPCVFRVAYTWWYTAVVVHVIEDVRQLPGGMVGMLGVGRGGGLMVGVGWVWDLPNPTSEEEVVENSCLAFWGIRAGTLSLLLAKCSAGCGNNTWSSAVCFLLLLIWHHNDAELVGGEIAAQ